MLDVNTCRAPLATPPEPRRRVLHECLQGQLTLVHEVTADGVELGACWEPLAPDAHHVVVVEREA